MWAMSQISSHMLAAIALASEAGQAPDWVQLTPAGPDLLARDGRRFRLSRPEAVIAAFRALGRDLQVDIEHASQVRATQGLSNPAVGWITDMEIRDGAIWGRVDWTEQGRDWVAARAYRFLSPAFAHVGGEMTEILSVGLTNEPAFRMAELARAGTEETEMDKTVLDELGLAPEAGADEVLAAIKALKADVATARDAAPDRDLFVPRAQHDAALARIARFEQSEAARADAALAALVDQGVADGKIVPAAKADFVEMARAQGAEKFAATLDKMPRVIGGPEAMDAKARETATVAALSGDELAVARQMGMSAEAYSKAKTELEA